MSNKLQLTTQSNAVEEKAFADLKKLFRVGFAHMRNAGAQMVGWRVIIGDYLNQAKEALPHGQFEDWVQKEFGLATSTQKRWREFSTLFLEEADKLPKKPVVGFLKSKKAAAVILDLAPKVLNGRGEIEFMQDCKLLKKPKPDGGFRPDAKKLEDWLKKHHPDLAGKDFDELPADVQKAFKKQYKPDTLSAEDRAEIVREEVRAWYDEGVKIFGAQGLWAELDDAKEREKIAGDLGDWAKMLKATEDQRKGAKGKGAKETEA